MIITISGLPGSGTTTVSKLLQKRLEPDFKLTSSGETFRQYAKDLDLSLPEFWELTKKEPVHHYILDRMQANVIKSDENCIVEGRLTGYIATRVMKTGKYSTYPILKIYLKARAGTRIERILEREMNNSDKTRQQVADDAILREQTERATFKRLYDIDIEYNLSFYDFVIDTTRLSAESVANIIAMAAQRYEQF